MSGNRKRRSSDSLESDRKRIPVERYDYDSYIKQECNSARSNYNGQPSYVAVPYNYVASSVAPKASVGVQSAVAYNKPQRYFHSQYVEPFDRNATSSVKHYSSGCNDALSAAYYDKQRQLNFKHDIYINSLRQSEPRIVNYNDLRKNLCGIDIRFIYNWNFSTALDLTLELESSLNYFVDTRNELVFLRKMQRQHSIPFSYNEINITNRNGMYNRMRFLENESAYRSNRMNLLFHQLQSVVIPSIIDDIRYVHSISYEKSWTNRARYWFTLFKQIKWENRVNSGRHKYQQSKHRRPHRRYVTTKDEVDPIDNVNIKSETGAYPKDFPFDSNSVKIEKNSKLPSRDITLHKQDPNPDSRIETVPSTDQPYIAPNVRNDNLVLNEIVESSHQEVTVESKDVDDVGADKESDRSNSCVIVEQDVSLVTLDDNYRDSSNIANPPEGDMDNEIN